MVTTIGVDVSKAELVLSLDSGKVRLKNELGVLEGWASSLSPDSVVGVEATGRLHRNLLRALSQSGVTAYLLNPMHVSRYCRALRPHVKNDRIDAVMIGRYLERERDMLTRYKMPSDEIQQLKDLLSYRQTVVEKRIAIRQSSSEQSFRLDAQTTLEAAFRKLIGELDTKIKALARKLPLYRRLLTIDGVGPLGAAALTWLFESHDFKHSDQAVAFVGLDVSVRQSGTYVGKTKLTKRGPAFVRAFLHNGANSLRTIPELKPLFEHHEAKKLSTTAVNNIIARKLVRIAYALHKTNEAKFERKNLLPQLT